MVKFLGKVIAVLLLLPVVLIFLFKWVAPPTSSFMIQKKVQLLMGDKVETRIRYKWADYEDISSHVKIAVIASEDQKFLRHSGFDMDAIRKALKSLGKAELMRGASTISQQVTKNLFLWPGRSLLRKGLEAYLTMFIEMTWSKRRILEIYLNIAQMGERIYGVGAASEFYFNRSAKDLSLEQAALLAAVLPNPSRYSVRKPSSHVLRRQAWILRQVRLLKGSKYLESL
jgi:monofunctional glycosyltransferase